MTYDSKYLDHREKILDARISGVYIKARKDLEKSLADFVAKKDRMSKAKKALVDAGKMSEAEYKEWLKRAVFRQQQWEQKVAHCTRMISESNEKALAIIRGEQYTVYTEGANHQAYEVEKRAHFQPDISFEIYDMATVEKLIEEKPALLPPKRINGKKDRAWNQGIISNCVTQGIIQGESVDKVAARIAKETQRQNGASMLRYARTALTAAQNAGRIDTMTRAKGMGINVKKKWLATLDRKTRHSHQILDGQVQEINRPFMSIFGEIMYPGDPEAEPGDVYNCRCTLEYVYPDFADLAENVERYDQEAGEVIDDMTYSEWKEWKNGQQKVDNRPKTAKPRFNWNGIGEEAAKSYEKALAELSEEMPLLHTELGYVGDFREAFGLDNDLDYYDFLDSHSGYDGVGAEFIPGSRFSQKPYILIFDQERNVLSAKEYLKALADIREKNGWHGKQNSFYDAAGGTEATIMHEYGHAIAYDCGLYWGGKNFDKLAKLYYSYTAEDIGRYVTLYATVSPQEMLAEAFVMSHEPRLNNPLITSVMELIKSCRGEK